EQWDAHYGLNDEQRSAAQKKMDQARENTVVWLLGVPDKDGNPAGAKTIKRTSPYGPPAEVTLTVPDRVTEYQNKLKEASDLQTRDLPQSTATGFEGDVNVKIRTAKLDAARMRADLKNDLDDQTKQRKELVRLELSDKFTEDQKKKEPLAEPVGRKMKYWSQLNWIDFTVRWGLLIIGLGLLLGLFTRLNCVGGAVMLLLFFLALPALPGLPDN